MKINIYLCKCGENISEKIDFDQITNEISTIKEVNAVKQFGLLCSEQGIDYLIEDIKKENATHVVIAACTPKKHEGTFQRAITKTHLNPYMFQMVNIREHCAWITTDPIEATSKAIALIKAGIQRVQNHEPLNEKEIELKSDVLIIGGGVAAVQAALLLSHQKRNVIIVEKTPAIGGNISKFEEVYPSLECAPCMVASQLQELLNKENVEVYTNSEVKGVVGSIGNFIAKIQQKPRYVDLEKCIGCGACIEVCPNEVANEFNERMDTRKAIYIPYPGSLPNVPTIDPSNCKKFHKNECTACQEACGFEAINFNDQEQEIEKQIGGIIVATGGESYNPEKKSDLGYKKIDNVLTSMEFERLVANNGPTNGEIILKNGKKPQSIVIIHCVGRGELHYCSNICCLTAIKHAHFIKSKNPESKVYNIHTDLVFPGVNGQKFFEKVKSEGMNLIQRKWNSMPKIKQVQNHIEVRCKNILNEEINLKTDMVILETGIVPTKDADQFASIFELNKTDSGFFEEEHEKLSDFATPIEGVFVVGCAQEPKNIEQSVSQSIASVGRLLSKLEIGGKLKLEPMVSSIDETICGACKLCISLCPYKAISFDEEKNVSVINEALCKGCGTCTAACPTGAIKSKHFTSPQIISEIKEVAKW